MAVTVRGQQVKQAHPLLNAKSAAICQLVGLGPCLMTSHLLLRLRDNVHKTFPSSGAMHVNLNCWLLMQLSTLLLGNNNLTGSLPEMWGTNVSLPLGQVMPVHVVVVAPTQFADCEQNTASELV